MFPQVPIGTGKQVLVYFWMNGSEHCTNLWGKTLTDPGAEADLSVAIRRDRELHVDQRQACGRYVGPSSTPCEFRR